MYELQSRIEKRSNFLLQTIEKWREIYLCKINQYAQKYENIREDIAAQFQSIDQRIQVFLSYESMAMRIFLICHNFLSSF